MRTEMKKRVFLVVCVSALGFLAWFNLDRLAPEAEGSTQTMTVEVAAAGGAAGGLICWAKNSKDSCWSGPDDWCPCETLGGCQEEAIGVAANCVRCCRGLPPNPEPVNVEMGVEFGGTVGECIAKCEELETDFMCACCAMFQSCSGPDDTCFYQEQGSGGSCCIVSPSEPCL